MQRELDTEAFWRDDEIAQRDNCFFRGPQTAFGIRMSTECVYDELGIQGDPWLPIPRDKALELYKRYNDKAEAIVGRRLLNEEILPESARFPYVKRIGEVFGGEYRMIQSVEWLDKCISDVEQLKKTLERVENMDFRAFMLPDNWASEKKRIYETYGLKPPLMRHIRGPVTLACSLMGTEEFLFFCIDEPEMAERFSRAITHAILGMAQVMDEEAGVTPESKTGFTFADDNCCLMTPAMYGMFGYPVLRDVFSVYSPSQNDNRYQHSDSPMGHLLPILGKLDLTGVNFGPTVLAPEIRKHLPHARIDGCIDPMVFMRNESEELVRQTIRDCEADALFGGVNIATAGSINYGSSLESMRLIMTVIQNYSYGTIKETHVD